MQDFLFTYDNVCLRPKYSELPTRSQADTSITFLGQKFRIPVIPANMQDVISWDLSHELALNDYFYIMHRFDKSNFESKGHYNHIEGHTLAITEGCTYAERMIEIQQALQSAISYAGGKDLSAFNSVEWEILK